MIWLWVCYFLVVIYLKDTCLTWWKIIDFSSGKKSKDPSNPDYVPSVFKHTGYDKSNKEQKSERHSRMLNRRKNVESSTTLNSTMIASSSSAFEEEASFVEENNLDLQLSKHMMNWLRMIKGCFRKIKILQMKMNNWNSN